MTATQWDVSTYFASVESREFADAEERFGAEVQRLAALYDRHDVRGGATPDEPSVVLDEVVEATNRVLGELQLLRSFLNAFVSTDATDATAQAAMSRLQRASVELTTLTTRLDAWTAGLDLDAVVETSEIAAAHEWPLRKGLGRAEHLMSGQLLFGHTNQDSILIVRNAAGYGTIVFTGDLILNQNVRHTFPSSSGVGLGLGRY